MRKWFACLGVLGLAATAATAQTIPSSISNYLNQTSEDDGRAETSWKIYYPSAANEGYDVDFNTDAAGVTVFGVAVQTYVSLGTTQNFLYIALCGDNLAIDPSGRTPDLGSPLSILNNATAPSTPYCTGFTTYDLPDVNVGTGGVHATLAFPTGDTTTWICSDSFDANFLAHTGPRHSFFTTDNYATPASYPLTHLNWMIRLANSPPTPNGGAFYVNGSLATNVGGGNTIALQFWSADSGAPTKYLEVLDLGGPMIPLPGIILQTGLSNFLPIPIQALGQLTGAIPCSAIGLTLMFRAFFQDNLDLKKNGHKKIKLTAAAAATIVGSKTCNPNLCFGQRDDNQYDNWIVKVASPAGSKDAMTVPMGFVSPLPPVVTNLTAVEQITWDFCSGPDCWQQIGIYPANTVVDPSGNSPDLSNPIASLGGTSACYPGPFGGASSYPGQTYDTPDVTANTTTNYHVTAEWANFDSCLWIGADINGTADDAGLNCGDNTSSFDYTYFTRNGFATPGTNWVPYEIMQRIVWN